MSLADDVESLEASYEEAKEDVRMLEENLCEVEQDLEEAHNELTKLREFKAWVDTVYPEIIKDYSCVKIIEEKANECS
jgi:chromosome segregation ATPase